MEITRVTCNGCGAALEVGERARFANCRYCGAKLEIKHTASAVFTEVLESIGKNTSSMAEDLDAIRREKEIERLDRDWQLRRQGLLTSHKDGTSSAPSAIGGVLIMVIGGGFGLFWTIMAFNMTSRRRQFFEAMPFPGGPGSALTVDHSPGIESIFPIFGIIAIIASVGMGIAMMMKAGTYEREQEAYRRNRARLTGESSADSSHRRVSDATERQHTPQ